VTRSRVLLADDHHMMTEGLVRLLGDEFELVSVVDNGRDMVAAAKNLRPDVIVADISMPILNGIDALAQLKADNPEVKVVFLTMHHDAHYARRALEAGAVGYVLKHSAHVELMMAIRAALSGNTFVTPTLSAKIFQMTRRPPAADGDPTRAVTERQREILQLLAEGCSAKIIAHTLGISARTVEFHKYNMMEAFNLRSSAELILFAIKRGIVSV
jgi:DNA-binding NarL/FixJ family response regulator